MERRKHRRAVIAQVLPRCGLDGGLYLFELFIIAVSPVPAQRVLAAPRLTAGEVRADLRSIAVAAGRGTVERIAARRDALRFQRFRFKGRGHLRRDDSDKIALHIHLLHLIAVLYRDGLRRRVRSLCRSRGRFLCADRLGCESPYPGGGRRFVCGMHILIFLRRSDRSALDEGHCKGQEKSGISRKQHPLHVVFPRFILTEYGKKYIIY